jgi:hypothetical protein
MMNNVSINSENLVINNGEVSAPSPPPSSAEKHSTPGQTAFEVDISIRPEIPQKASQSENAE